jgi:predicted lipoprotein
MTKFLKQYGVAALLALGMLASCKDEPTNTPDVNFDRKAMLQNIADNVIVPEYATFKRRVIELDAAINTFTSAPDAAALQQLRANFKTAYLAWQRVSAFEIGHSADLALRANVNTFPTDVTIITGNINSGTYNLGAASSLKAKGFPSLDYLLYGAGTEEDVLKLYTTDADAAKRINYLKAISNDLKVHAVGAADSWAGNYRTTFINNTGTDKGSSIGQLVNELNFDWEIIKNPKIGIPLGIKSMNTPIPKNVEAYYSGMSLELALENAKALLKLYKGGDGLGLDDYLNAYNAKHSGTTLDAAIQAQMNVAINALADVPNPLSKAITDNPTIVNKAYTEFQKTVVLLKTDMPSILGVSITYQDTDGD